MILVKGLFDHENTVLLTSLLLTTFLFMVIILINFYHNHKLYLHLVQSLQYREDLFNSLCSNIDDVYIIIDIDKLKYEYISPNMERIFGISVNRLKEDPNSVIRLIEENRRDELYNIFCQHKLKDYYEFECSYFHEVKNQEITIAFRIYPIIKNLKVIRYIFCVSDLTEAKKSQEMIQNAYEYALKANEAKKEFLSHISHELKTPVNEIMGMAQMASGEREDQNKLDRYLNNIVSSSNKLIAIINNILDAVKVDSNKLLLVKEPFLLSDFLNNYSNTVRIQTDLKQQNFDLITDIKHTYINGDSLRLEQILSNCITNAIKFTPKGGSIKLEVYETEAYQNKVYYRFIVTDNGKGMKEEFINRIFIPFEQEEPTLIKKYGGSGLGMFIVKSLVSLMDGTIQIMSKPNQGTQVMINISFELDATLDAAPCQPPDYSGHRILVVEDNPINLEIIEEQLSNIHFTVDTALNGFHALRLFLNSPPGFYDLILMDIQMPEVGGFETADLIRSSDHPDAETIVIIALSADSLINDMSQHENTLMNYYITKPMDMNYFYTILNKIIT